MAGSSRSVQFGNDPKLTEARWLCETLGEIFCLTFVRGVDAAEALRRMGGYPDTFAELGPEEIFERQNSYLAGYPQIAGAVELGGWALLQRRSPPSRSCRSAVIE
ncbi:DUF6461 domain-containing protein [Frankia sp. QA3]|uniref:DUF6461 domain-containing protein n=1 Tax=Frankia sp. QA3 TaxID=710111 RepID=UPI000269BDE8|nr:DUF6461 domain-containing protein [Frankia sp. QA3]EIV92821.1 hypothetical protein FraQA3DRAFT_2474 [Frankia sp. QA3]